MKKNIFICSMIILSLSLSNLIIINIKINIDSNNNKLVIEEFNNIYDYTNLDYSTELIKETANLEINGIDYVGIITIENEILSLPIKSNCNNNILNNTTTCKYNGNPFILLGTNLKNSFSSYKNYNINDKVIFTNTLGEKYLYKIEKIKRVDDLKNISQHNYSDLIIIVKDYYDLNYILFICKIA